MRQHSSALAPAPIETSWQALPPRRAGRGIVGWWWRLTAPPEPPASASFAVRERFRRGRLASVLLFGLVLIGLGALWQYLVVDDDHPTMKLVLIGALVAAGVVALLNRKGRVTAAGLLLVALADLPLAGIPATALGGRLDVPHLSAFYLLASAVLVAASLLAPWSVFVVALTNSLLVVVVILALPHTTALNQLLASNNGQQALAGPAVMQVIVAIVAFLWARSTLTALRRADRAEELADLERREVERTRELEEGVEQLLAVHVQLANGNFAARAPTVRNPLLWQIGASLNTLVARFGRLAQVDFTLRRTQEEAHRLAEAVLTQRGGRAPVWPTPTGTPLDEVVVALGGYTPTGVPSSATLGGLTASADWRQAGGPGIARPAADRGQAGQAGPQWVSTDSTAWIFPPQPADSEG